MPLPLPETHVGSSVEATQDQQNSTSTPAKKHVKWVVVLYCTMAAVGTIGGPLLQRLYYTHGGSSKWLSSWLQSSGFFILGPPVAFVYFKRFSSENGNLNKEFFLEPKLIFSSAAIGVIIGFDNFLYSAGLSAIPVTTSTLLFSTQLAFTALFAFIIIRQKLSFYSLNAVLVISLGAAVLALHSSNDQPVGVTKSKYLLGFLLSLLGAALVGLIYPLTELAYSKSTKKNSFLMVLQFQFLLNLFATLFASVGMLSSNDYKSIPKEAEQFGLGESKYIMLLVASAVIWQLTSLGVMGVISCTSSLFAGILSAVLLPLTEIGAIITFGEKFGGEKALSMILCIWGFTSYFYGEYTKNHKTEPKVELDIP